MRLVFITFSLVNSTPPTLDGTWTKLSSSWSTDIACIGSRALFSLLAGTTRIREEIGKLERRDNKPHGNLHGVHYQLGRSSSERQDSCIQLNKLMKLFSTNVCAPCT